MKPNNFMFCGKCKARLTPRDVSMYGTAGFRRCSACRTVNRHSREARIAEAITERYPETTRAHNPTFPYALLDTLRALWEESWVATFMRLGYFNAEAANIRGLNADNGVFSYQQNGRIVRQRCARFARAFLAEGVLDLLVDADFEVFNNVFTAATRQPTFNFELVTGEEIRRRYLISNYGANVGRLRTSCMAGENAQGYLDIYAKNPNSVALLTAMGQEDGKVHGRTLVWTATDGSRYHDTVYANDVVTRQIENKATEMGIRRLSEMYERGGVTVQLEHVAIKDFPSMDSMGALNLRTKTIQSYRRYRDNVADTISSAGTQGGYYLNDKRATHKTRPECNHTAVYFPSGIVFCPDCAVVTDEACVAAVV